MFIPTSSIDTKQPAVRIVPKPQPCPVVQPLTPWRFVQAYQYLQESAKSKITSIVPLHQY